MAISKTLIILVMTCVVAKIANSNGTVVNDLPPGPPDGPGIHTSTTSSTTAAPNTKTTVTTPKPTTTLTTVAPSTTAATTTKTTPSTTTTAKTTTEKTTTAKTTTAKTTTVAPVTTTSTAKPTTTTVQPITTTVAPVPVDPPKQGTWRANYTGTNNSCIILQVALQIDFYYQQHNSTTTLPINLPANATSLGTCINNTDVQTIALNWNPRENVTNKIVFVFGKINGTKDFDLKAIYGSVNVSIPGLGYRNLNWNHTHEDFHTPISNSYKCAKEQTRNLTVKSEVKNVTASLKISHLQMEAFRTSADASFSTALDCQQQGTPDVVPIAVGCALAALVIIVLVAYLVGRRRSQARGYLSMFTDTKREEDYIPMNTLSCFK